MGDLSSLKKTESGQEVVRPFSAYNLKKNDTVKSTDKTPFLFRPIPPLSTPYIREKLVGASMVWNQLVYNKSYTNSSDIDSRTMVGFQVRQINDSYTNLVSLLISSTGTYQFISKPSKNGTAIIFRHSGETSNLTFTNENINTYANHVYLFGIKFNGVNPSVINGLSVDNMQAIDLTLAFSPAIADRIYSMEQAQAGSGIAWIKSYGFLTDDYYANDAGSIQSVCVDRKEIVGFNQWDEEWEVGIFNTHGELRDNANCIRSKNKIAVFPSTNYCIAIKSSISRIRVIFLDINGNFISAYDYTNQQNVFMTLSNCHYIHFSTIADSTPYYGGTYKHDICINISDTAKNGTYEPYHKTTISLGHDTLRGVMQLDANNNLVYYGDEKASDGVIDRKFGIADLGSLEWVYDNTFVRFYANLPQMKLTTSARDLSLICSKYICIDDGRSLSNVPDKSIYNGYSGAPITARIYVHDSAYSDATVFGAAMSGVYLVYPLATPTTEQSTPFESPQYLFDGGTEEFIDYGVEQETRDVAVPVGHVTEYMGASDGTEIKDKFYLPTLPDDDGIYDLNCLIQNGVVREFSWRLSNEGYSPSYRGKNIVHMGDSWVELYNIAELASEFVGYRVTNVGFQASAITNVYDGTPVTDADKFSLIKLAHALETNVWTEQDTAAVGKSWEGQLAKLKAIDWSLVDVLILSYGVNDFNYQSAIGDAEARDEESVGGALKTAIGILENLNPYMEIVITTPCFRFMSPDSDNMTNFGTRILLEEYRNVIGLTAKECGIKLVDMGAISGINEYNRSLTLLSDGLHPTQLGQIMWADAFAKSLECGYTGAFDINVFNVLKDGDNLCFDSEQYTKHKKWNASYTSNLTKYLCTRATQQYKNMILGQAFFASLPTGSVLRMTGIGKKIGTQNHRVDIYVYNSDKSTKLLEKTSSAIKYTDDTAFDHSWTTTEDYTNCWVIFAVKQMSAWADGKGLVRDVKCTVTLPS